jgi:pimeloyl-ACP methyl ester carboxylesterase
MLEAGEIISYPLSVAGVMTRLLEARGGDDAVLFVHGVGARADRWRRNLPVIAQAGFRCLAVDLPGHGFAQKGEGFDYGVPGYAAFIASLLDALHVACVHFVGTSLGAHILAAVACDRPDAVRSFTLIGATGMFPIGAEARYNIARRITDLSRIGIAQKLRTVIFDSALVSESMIEEEWLINNSPGAARTFDALGSYFRERLDDDVVGQKLKELSPRHRRLIIWGQEDRSVPLAIGRKVEKLLEAPLIVIAGAAHTPYLEAPEAFNQTLQTFLKGK